MLRPSGFTWDPGGLFPIMLITAYALGASRLLAAGSFGSLLAVSRTALLTAFTIWLARRSARLGWALVVLALLVLPAVAMIYAEVLSDEFTDGTVRHLAYPGLAIVSLLEHPRYLLLGDGLRGGAAIFLDRPEAFIAYFFDVDELLKSEARHLIVESIWVNQLTGAGLIGFAAYAIWLCKGLAKHPATLLGLIIAGTYYTFDSSAYCFVVPFLMTVPASMHAKPLGRRAVRADPAPGGSVA